MCAGAFSSHAASSLIPYGKKSNRPRRTYIHDEFNPVEIKESFARNFSRLRFHLWFLEEVLAASQFNVIYSSLLFKFIL